MEKPTKPGFGQPRDWGLAIGGLIAIVGLLRLISGVWTPDTVAEAGSGNLTAAVITIVVGIVIAGASILFFKKV